MIHLQPSYCPLAAPAQFHRFLAGAGSEKGRVILAESARYDWHGRKIFFEPYLRALILHRCGVEKTLHDLQAGVTSDALYAMVGAHMEVSVPALSQANATRPIEPFMQVLAGVLQAIEYLPSSAKVLRQVDTATLRTIAHLLTDVKVFDATTFPLSPKLAEWARVNEQWAGFKVQLRLSGGYGGLDRIFFTQAAGNDNPSFQDLLDLQPHAGAIYLFDTGYFKIDTYDQIVETGNHFLTLLHGKMKVNVVKEHPVPSSPLPNGYHVHADQRIRLGQGKRQSSHLYRLVTVTDSRGKEGRILTSLVDLPVEQVCALRTYRWTVETVIRWLKKSLHLDHLISYSPKGVILQVVIALIVYGLLVVYNQQAPLSLARLLRRLRTDLHQALYEWGFQQGYQMARQEAHGLSPPPPITASLAEAELTHLQYITENRK